MKATPTKTEAAQPAKKTAPFFNKGAGQGFFKPAATGIQTKLTVGEPNDVYEREANATADRVVKGMHAEPAAGGRGGGAGKGISRKPIFESENDAADTVQKKAAGGGAPAASPAVESGISGSKGSGATLPSATRSQMESSFGADFSGVRVHQDSGAQKMNKDLNAQAFTHGKDIYFDSGKYNPGSSEGKHLLAHELTHVVQQTGAGAPKKTAQRKTTHTPGSTNKASTPASTPTSQRGAGAIQQTAGTPEGILQEAPQEMEPLHEDAVQTMPAFQSKAGRPRAGLQKAGSNDGSGKKKDLKDITAPTQGRIETSKTMVLTNFPLKKYENVRTPNPPGGRVRKPKPGTRNTKQDRVWKKNVKTPVTTNIKKVAGNEPEGKMLMMTVKGKGGKKNQGKMKTQILGDVDTLSKATTVPFWNKDAVPTIHQIEHIIDWQVLGGQADTLPNNLILLDKETNRQMGDDIRVAVNAHINKVQAAYQKEKIDLPIATAKVDDAYLGKYNIDFENLQAPKTPLKKGTEAESIIQQSDIEDANGIISKNTIEISDPKIPEGYCVIKTAKSGEGYFIKYDGDNGVVKTKGKAKAKDLVSIEQKQLVKGNGDVMQGSKGALKLKFYKDKALGEGYFKLVNTGHATELKEMLKLRGLSPMEFDPEIEVSPVTGITAEGKVKSDISFLKDADIDVSLSNGEFTVSATITSDALKGKLPKPLSVDSSDLTLSVSSGKAWYIGGGVDFSIKNVGSGSLSGHIGDKGFGLDGTFSFDEKKSFKKAEIAFSYFRESGKGEGKWSGSGALIFGKDVIPGIKDGDIKIGYKDGVISGAGIFNTTISKLDTVKVAAQFDDAGNFTITGDTALKGVPGIKDNHITATLSKDASGFALAIIGTATPDLPNVPGLGATLTVSYNKGVFTLQGTATYKRDKLEGALTVGVTNATVDDNGVPSTDASDDKIKIFGNGAITLHLLKGVTATLAGAVDGNGEVFIWGNMNVEATPFDRVDIDKTLFDVKTSIPLVGIPFASINLDLGTSGKFYFHWDPLTIKLQATLDRTNIKNIGEAGGELTASLSSHAKTGFIFTISAGVSVSIAIIKLGAHLNGNVDLGLDVEAGAEAKAHWDMQKGLTLESAEAHLKGVPEVIFSLTGDITADVDLWLTSYNVYKKEMTLGQTKLDLSQFAFGVSVPLKITDDGKVEGIDFSKIKIEPEMGEGAGDKISDQVLNGDDRKKKEQKEREAKEKIRNRVVQKLQSKKADGDTDYAEYANDLKSDIKDDTPDELAGIVDQIVDEEVAKMIKQREADLAAWKEAAAKPGSGVPSWMGGPPDDDDAATAASAAAAQPTKA